MFQRNTLFVMCLAVFGCTAVFASYGSGAGPAWGPADAIGLQALGEAQASALSNAAGAGAAAAKIPHSERAALDRYGLQIGVPLLTRAYGPATNLYAAALPPRSFVGQIDPEFREGPYGGITHISTARIAAVAI